MESSIPQIDFDQFLLPNGLTVMLHHDPRSPVAAVVVMYHVGSKNEKPGRTGLAHLFEHMMFKGSQHVGDGEHFRLLQEIGANINGTTSEDRTNYYEVIPANALELALFLESDRMGYFLEALTQEKLDNQRDVVKNERRQNYDNQPYGTAGEKIGRALFPQGHPYSWPVIGVMEDLSAASLNEINEFFRTYYAPNNACLVIAGNFDAGQTRDWIFRYFGPIAATGEIPRPGPPPVSLMEEKRIVFEDRVQLPRLYLSWPGFPMNTREDAVLDVITAILGSGRNSRLYRSLVYDLQIAQTVSAFHDAMEIAGVTAIEVTAKENVLLSTIEEHVAGEIERICKTAVTESECRGVLNRIETNLVFNRSTALGKANALATYFTLTGEAHNVNLEFNRYALITPEEIRQTAAKCLGHGKVALSIVPSARADPAAGN